MSPLSRPHACARGPFGVVRAAAPLLAAAALYPALSAGQTPPDGWEDDFVAPVAGSWEPVRSMGQPPLWKPFVTLGFGVDRTPETDAAGVTGSVGVFRDVLNPMFGFLGATGEVYVGQRGSRFDAGGRVLVESPLYSIHAGADWNLRRDRVDFVLGSSFPLRRGGWPTRGSQVRLEWIPTRDHSVVVGASFPLRQPHAGRTRPRRVDAQLPLPPGASRVPRFEEGTPEAAALAEVAESMRWLVDLHTFFWLTDVQSLRYEESLRQWRTALREFRLAMVDRETLRPGQGTYEREVQAYHEALARAFGLALGAPEAEAADRGRALAERARRVALEEVVFPYNRTVGQYKQPDVLDGFIARARARFIAWMELSPEFSEGATGPVLSMLDGWLQRFEASRADMARVIDDSRMHWLPLALVLRPEEHATQAQIDALVERALERPFEGGNRTAYMDAPRFQQELLRTIHETDRYHVLWIHDYRGRDAFGNPDATAFHMTAEGYLRALLDRVRAYDETGHLPVYIVLLDQYFYEANDGRLWMTLLEDPLEHRIRLGSRHREMEERLVGLQDSLRAAVRGSRRLQAQADALGPEWVRGVVKIHVNITNPSDFTFRSRRLLGARLGADNLLRDHRKVVIRDVSERDPGEGEVILTGVGVGDHYASPTWEDRALLLRGPGALAAREHARAVLLQNGFRESEIPHVLRPEPRGEDYARRIRELEAEGWDARVLQAHNATGWGPKQATFVQMLLYDLVPPGTVIYVPDSLWTSYQWMAQLVNAALRGCRVYVVAPALANAPSAGFTPMSVMQELVSRLVLVEEEFAGMIERAGGKLRVGLFSRERPLADLEALVAELDRALASGVFLAGEASLAPETRALLAELRADGGDVPFSLAGPDELADRPPQLHVKTQLLASGAVLDALAASPGLAEVVRDALEELRDVEVRVASGPSAGGGGAAEVGRRLRDLVESLEVDEPGVLYFMTGSINKNVRSMALDGEALAVVAGPWALQAYFDFALLTGGVTWIEDLTEVERLLPPFSPFQRRIARWLHSVL